MPGARVTAQTVTPLYSFTPLSPSPYNSDGADPSAPVVLSGNTLYGTTWEGGSGGLGTVFSVHVDGTGFTLLHTFGGGSDGQHPAAGLVLSGSTLYGTADLGGNSGRGTLFKLNTDGTGFVPIYSFSGGLDGGALPGRLALSGNTLYGTTYQGGATDRGTIFKVDTDGSSFTSLYSFTGGTDGNGPEAGLILAGNILYGTTGGGGGSGTGFGAVFAINTDGTGFTIIHAFTGGGSEGSAPEAGLIQSGNTLYGTAFKGGEFGRGTVFSIALLPKLTIDPYGIYGVLKWPTNAIGFTLQSTTNLDATTVWLTNSVRPVVVDGWNTVSNPFVTGKQRFYRLIK